MENSDLGHKNPIDNSFEIYDFPPEDLLNKKQDILHLGDILFSKDIKNNQHDIPIVLGKDSENKNIIFDLEDLPHLLIAGTTGVGKSTFLDSLLISMLYTCKPSKLKLILVDTRIVNFSKFNGIPHLILPVITDAGKATGAFCWLLQELENRYNLLAKKNVRDINSYNQTVGYNEKLSKLVVVIDEFSDLILEGNYEFENIIYKLTKLGRAIGIHLIISTQRPSSDIINGKIKANIPARIAFKVASKIDSKLIIDTTGAETLSNKGEILYKNGNIEATKVKVSYISDNETSNILKFIKQQNAYYDINILDDINNINEQDINKEDEENEEDPLLQEAINIVIETSQASTSFLQRRLKIGYARAGKIIDQLEKIGIISGYQGSKPREVLIHSKNTRTETENINNYNVKTETNIPSSKMDSKTNDNKTSEWNVPKILTFIVFVIIAYLFLIAKGTPQLLKILFVIWSVFYCLKKTLPMAYKTITKIVLLIVFCLLVLSILGVFGEFLQYLSGFILFIFILICFLGSGSNPSGWYH